MSATFAYRVRDALGKSIAGTLEASTTEDAAQKLRREGFQVIEVAEQPAEDGGLFPRRVTRQELMYTTNQLAVLVDTGVSLSAALAGIIEEEQNPRWKGILRELKVAVEGGEDFSSALGRYPRLFDPTYVALVKASEATGTLGPMLDRIAAYLRSGLETRGKIRAALAYPSVMLVLAVGVTIFLLTYILPKFIPIFQRKGATLPQPTVLVMGISDVLTQHWPWCLAAAGCVAGVVVWARKSAAGQRACDWLLLHLPLVGPVFRKVVLGRALRTLGMTLNSGVPLLTALELTGQVSGNDFYRQLWREVSEKVVTGTQIHAALSRHPLVPPMLVQMISAGEQTGRLSPVLERVSEHYDQEIETSLKTLTSLLEPLMISVMGVVVGGIAMALMLPIFTLSRHAG